MLIPSVLEVQCYLFSLENITSRALPELLELWRKLSFLEPKSRKKR